VGDRRWRLVRFAFKKGTTNIMSEASLGNGPSRGDRRGMVSGQDGTLRGGRNRPPGASAGLFVSDPCLQTLSEFRHTFPGEDTAANRRDPFTKAQGAAHLSAHRFPATCLDDHWATVEEVGWST